MVEVPAVLILTFDFDLALTGPMLTKSKRQRRILISIEDRHERKPAPFLLRASSRSAPENSAPRADSMASDPHETEAAEKRLHLFSSRLRGGPSRRVEVRVQSARRDKGRREKIGSFIAEFFATFCPPRPAKAKARASCKRWGPRFFLRLHRKKKKGNTARQRPTR